MLIGIDIIIINILKYFSFNIEDKKTRKKYNAINAGERFFK